VHNAELAGDGAERALPGVKRVVHGPNEMTSGGNVQPFAIAKIFLRQYDQLG
jgi:hypothetical protein